MSNAIEAKPEIIIQLDKPRKFKLDWNAMRALERKAGKAAVKAIDWEDPGFEDLTLIVWAGLLTEDPTLTADFVGEHLDKDAIEHIHRVIAQASQAAMPKATEAELKNAEATSQEK